MKKSVIIPIVAFVLVVIIAGALYFFYPKPKKFESHKFNGGKIFFTETVSLMKVDTLGKYLVASGFFDGTPKALKFDKVYDKDGYSKYEIYQIIKPGEEKNQAFIDKIEELAYNIACEVLDSTALEIHLCNEKFKTLKIIKPREGYSVYGKKLEFDGSELYYLSVGEYWATKLGEYLVKIGFFNDTLPQTTTQLTKSNQVYQFKIIVPEGAEEDQRYINTISQFAQELSFNVFDSAKTEIHLCDKNLKTIKVVKPKR